jgi:hypothetical protein
VYSVKTKETVVTLILVSFLLAFPLSFPLPPLLSFPLPLALYPYFVAYVGLHAVSSLLLSIHSPLFSPLVFTSVLPMPWNKILFIDKS